MNYRDKVYNTLFLDSLLGSSDNESSIDNNEEKIWLSYKPKNIRGFGSEREGCCGICGKWFKLKTSSYWYHMNYKHGINSNGYKFPEPNLRQHGMNVEGYCKECNKWINLGTNRTKINFGWFRHWQKTHSKSKSI